MQVNGKKACIMLAIGAAALLSGCGSDDSSSSTGISSSSSTGGTGSTGSTGGTSGNPTTTLSGQVIDGYWRGARVCLDVNNNNQCDAGEPSATTDNNAAYTLTGVDTTHVKDDTFIIAEVIKGVTVDYDPTSNTETAMDATASVMKAPSTTPTYVNPFTTQITEQIGQGKSLDDSVDYVVAQQGITEAQLFSDYYAGDTPNTEVIAKAQDTYKKSINGINKIGHIVVIYLENRSFDSLFNNFPGANGWENNKTNHTQVDINNAPYTNLPMYNARTSPTAEGNYMGSTLPFPGSPDSAKGKNNPESAPGNAPWLMDDYKAKWYIIPDILHVFWNEQHQINGGKMDKYALYNHDSDGMSLGYNDMSGTNLWQYAKDYVLCDNFFMSAFGGSFLNHQFLVAAQAPVIPEANITDAMRDGMISEYKNTQVNKTGEVNASGDYNSSATETPIMEDRCTEGEYSQVPCLNSPDYNAIAAADRDNTLYAINTSQPWYMPYDFYLGDDDQRIPPQTHATIGDSLMDANITWNWYAGGYDIAMGKEANGDYKRSGGDVNFQFHHNPLAYFKSFGFNDDGTPTEGRKHIRDDNEMFGAIADGSLPQVTFWKPSADINAHPGYSSISGADAAVADVVSRIQANSAIWEDTAIIITTDENGGLWDHVVPPKRDKFGPGNRIPAIIISPYAKKGYVDKTHYETTSILAFIEKRFGLDPLVPSRDGNISNLMNAFEF